MIEYRVTWWDEGTQRWYPYAPNTERLDIAQDWKKRAGWTGARLNAPVPTRLEKREITPWEVIDE